LRNWSSKNRLLSRERRALTSVEYGSPERLVRLFAVRSYSIGLGIALAGAVYPCVMSIGILLLTVVQLNHFPKFNPSLYHSDIEEAIAIVFYCSTLGAGVGFLSATVICIAVLPFVYLVVLSLQARGSLTRLGAFCGRSGRFHCCCADYHGCDSILEPQSNRSHLAISRWSWFDDDPWSTRRSLGRATS